MAGNSVLMNASGVNCTTEGELLEVLHSPHSGAAITKSMTLLPREGNPYPRYATVSGGSVNSTGLANLGVDAYCEMMPRLKSVGKPVFASIAGFSLEENVQMASLLSQTEVDYIELNLSCPNIAGKGMVGYDMGTSLRYIDAVMDESSKPVGVKLPYYPDDFFFDKLGYFFKQLPLAHIATINSLKGMPIEFGTHETAIHPNKGIGGVGGYVVKHMALYNVRKWYETLEDSVPIIGMGGVYTGSDAHDFIIAGASRVAIGTTLMQEGVDCFRRINEHLYNITQGDYLLHRGTLQIKEAEQ